MENRVDFLRGKVLPWPSMLITNLPELVEYLKTAPKCDGVNHDWIQDEDYPEEFYCRGCFVIRGTENEVE